MELAGRAYGADRLLLTPELRTDFLCRSGLERPASHVSVLQLREA
ncbi:MAG: hypothetical protein ACLTYN_03805 [Dysosmobacter welbionis]